MEARGIYRVTQPFRIHGMESDTTSVALDLPKIAVYGESLSTIVTPIRGLPQRWVEHPHPSNGQRPIAIYMTTEATVGETQQQLGTG